MKLWISSRTGKRRSCVKFLSRADSGPAISKSGEVTIPIADQPKIWPEKSDNRTHEEMMTHQDIMSPTIEDIKGRLENRYSDVLTAKSLSALACLENRHRELMWAQIDRGPGHFRPSPNHLPRRILNHRRNRHQGPGRTGWAVAGAQHE